MGKKILRVFFFGAFGLLAIVVAIIAIAPKQPAAPAKRDATTAELGYPDSEAAIFKAVFAARGDYGGQPNELKKTDVFRRMAREMNEAFAAGGSIVKWRGILHDMGTTSDGRAWVKIDLGSDVTIMTWNNTLSDAGTGTLIPHASPVYAAVANIEKGDWVEFDARVMGLGNLTEEGKVDSTEMIARFTRIVPAPPLQGDKPTGG